MDIYPPSAKVISSNIDKIIPGESNNIKRPKSCKDIKRYPFFYNINNLSFLHKKTANKYNEKSDSYKGKGKCK